MIEKYNRKKLKTKYEILLETISFVTVHNTSTTIITITILKHINVIFFKKKPIFLKLIQKNILKYGCKM